MCNIFTRICLRVSPSFRRLYLILLYMYYYNMWVHPGVGVQRVYTCRVIYLLLLLILIFHSYRKNSNRLSERGEWIGIGIGAAEIFLNEMSSRSVRPRNNRADRVQWRGGGLGGTAEGAGGR